MAIIDVAVIGVGAMGKHHARIYSEMEDVNLVAVADLEINKVKEMEMNYNCKGYTDYRMMLSVTKPRAVSVAVPASGHYQVIKAVLPYAHVLVEKPLADIYANALILHEQAKRLNRVLMPGHILRFKPIVERLIELLDNDNIGEVYRIAFERHNKFQGRGGDVSVLMDVGVHDTDMLYYLYPSLLRETPIVHGSGLYNVCTNGLDVFIGRLEYNKCNLIVTFDYNRTNVRSKDSTRIMTLYGEKGILTVDWSKKGVQKDYKHRYYADQEHDALEAQLSEFIGKVMGEIGSGRVSTIDGVNAVKLAKELEHAALGA